ncbi:hypothetical protein GGF31_003023 [Allomyces arbusculus]|nr:hypothetical protein GGF31_003023 [Allomyces arbusculus]
MSADHSTMTTRTTTPPPPVISEKAISYPNVASQTVIDMPPPNYGTVGPAPAADNVSDSSSDRSSRRRDGCCMCCCKCLIAITLCDLFCNFWGCLAAALVCCCAESDDDDNAATE